MIYTYYMGKAYINNSETFNLFKNRPSFIRGVSGIFRIEDVSENYNALDTPQEADAKALSGDWKQVGKDISAALAQYEKEQVK